MLTISHIEACRLAQTIAQGDFSFIHPRSKRYTYSLKWYRRVESDTYEHYADR
jgi:hypothetical protein